jgi:DNA-binding SARP family transcriptional activator
MGVEIRLLGGFEAVVDGEPVPDRAWRLRKARTLVKLLALAPRRSLHRDQVLELLWSDRPPHRAANNLHQAVHAARRALGAEVIEVRDELLTLAGPVTVDVDDFEQAATRARKTGARQDYTTALDCWSGELLPEDLYETWTEPRRATLRDEHSSLCLELAEWHLQDGEFDAGLKRARSVLLDEPLHEPAHRLVMRAYAGAGRRQDALAQFEHLRDALRSDLAAEPDATTRALYRQLLASQGAEDPSPEALHLLPVQLTSFLGRDQEIVELGRLLTRERLVTLTGAGGVGKTRLALAGAAAGLERFPDGAWFIDLGSLTDPALVAEQAAVTVGLRVPAQR